MKLQNRWISFFVIVIAVSGGCSSQPAASPPVETFPAALAAAPDLAEIAGGSRVVDLTVLVSETLPAHWGDHPAFQRWTNNWFVEKKNDYGTVFLPSEGPYYSQRYVIDEHTGTQSDFPAHFIPPPDSGLPNAGPLGDLTGDKYPLSRMMGPAVVIDVTDLRDQAEPGMSARITLERVTAWEKEHGAIQAGEVVLLRTGYSDAYYKPLPEGLRLTFQPVTLKSEPAWPAPTPEVMEYLYEKGVWHMGIDAPSMGPVDAGQETHMAGLKHGMSWEELLIGLDQLPVRGSYYLALPIKIVDQSGSPTRAIAFVPNQ